MFFEIEKAIYHKLKQFFEKIFNFRFSDAF